MSRYIDTEAIDWCVVEDAYGSRSEAIVACEILIENQATVDAIKVVRCKDCKYCHYEQKDDIYHCYKLFHRFYDAGKHYCSYGERKETDYE